MKKTLGIVTTLLFSFVLVGCVDQAEGTDNKSNELNSVVHAEEVAVESSVEMETENNEGYTYADFKGIYALYEGEPFESDVIATTILSDEYLTDIVVEWMEYTVADISSVTVEGNFLSLDYEGEAEGPITSPAGTFTAQLNQDENGDKVLIINDRAFYPITQAQFSDLDLTVEEDLFSGL